jgi:hypothetical protein
MKKRAPVPDAEQALLSMISQKTPTSKAFAVGRRGSHFLPKAVG